MPERVVLIKAHIDTSLCYNIYLFRAFRCLDNEWKMSCGPL